MKKCCFCGEELPDTTAVCPWCGRRQHQQQKSPVETRGSPIKIEEEFSTNYRGWLYPRIRRSKSADPAFLAIEPALQHRDWEEVEKLLKWIADCLGVPSVLHPQMSIDIVQRIIKYPFRELRVDNSELIDEIRARWAFCELMQASDISPGHWLVERELIAILLGHDYDLVLQSPKFPYNSPHSTSKTERTRYCPDYPKFALLSRKGRRGMLFAIHCNFKGDVVSGACLREYLHDDYEDAISECIQAGFLLCDLKMKDYLHHLSNQTLQAILRDHGIKPMNSKSDLVGLIGQTVASEELAPFLEQFVKPSDLHMVCQARQLRKLLNDEKERFSSWFFGLKQFWGMYSPVEPVRRDPIPARPEPSYVKRMFMNPVVNFTKPSLEKVASLPVWSDYWDAKCDAVVIETAKELGWNGFFEAARKIKEYWGPTKVAAFESVTSKLAPTNLGIVGVETLYYSLLEFYCEARRVELGISGLAPVKRICHHCKREYNDASIPAKLASFAGYYLGYCRECLGIAFYRAEPGSAPGNPTIDSIDALVELCAALGQVPQLKFIKYPTLPRGLEPQRLERIIQALIDLPDHTVYLEEFGSWFKTLIAVGILGDEPIKTQRGYKSIANDGHECGSLAELTIDNWMTTNKVAHEREPKYPFHSQWNANEGFRADWKVGEYYIEYFGMMEDAEYQSKAKKKIKLAGVTGINLITLLPKDILTLERALAVLCPTTGKARRDEG